MSCHTKHWLQQWLCYRSRTDNNKQTTASYFHASFLGSAASKEYFQMESSPLKYFPLDLDHSPWLDISSQNNEKTTSLLLWAEQVMDIVSTNQHGPNDPQMCRPKPDWCTTLPWHWFILICIKQNWCMEIHLFKCRRAEVVKSLH